MVLGLIHPVEDFTGLVLDIHTPSARGIYDLEKTRNPMKETIKDFFRIRGVSVAEGFRPGIGSAAAGQPGFLTQLMKSVPAIGKLLVTSVTAAKLLRARIAESKKRTMRPFKPSVGVHLEIWEAPHSRRRTEVSSLMETLSMLPDLRTHMASKHPGIEMTFLVTSKGESFRMPPVRIDSDACSDSSVVQLAAKVKKGLESTDPPTHFSLSRRWGVWPRVDEHRDKEEAFHLVFLFPGNLKPSNR